MDEKSVVMVVMVEDVVAETDIAFGGSACGGGVMELLFLGRR